VVFKAEEHADGDGEGQRSIVARKASQLDPD